MLLVSLASAQSFKTEQLRQAAMKLGVECKLDTLKPDQTYYFKAKDGQPFCVRTDKRQDVEHIGIPLFNETMRALMPSPVYDFLEYAVLNWKYRVNPNSLYLSKVFFRKGSWNSLLKDQLDECDCSIENVDDKLYVVTWQRDSMNIDIVGFPIEYELLCNESRRNIERNFIRQLANYQSSLGNRQHNKVMEGELKIYGTGGLFVKEGHSFLMSELNQNVYYILKTIYEPIDTIYNGKLTHMVLEDVQPAIVVDNDHPLETFANFMMSDDSDVPDVVMDIDFHLSNYHNQQFALPLSQLKNFCREQGDDLFFAFSGITQEEVKGVLFAVNVAKGYNHLFSLRMSKSMLVDSNPTIKVNAYLYIPSISREKLFGKTPSKKSGVKIY